MKSFPLMVSMLSLACLPCAAQDVIFRISPETGVSSDRVTICRVTATNVSGFPLDGRQVGFEASAIEDGVVVERERGRFGGVLRNGETAETLIGFNGEYHGFEIVGAPVSDRGKGAGRGSKNAKKGSSAGASKKRPKRTARK